MKKVSLIVCLVMLMNMCLFGISSHAAASLVYGQDFSDPSLVLNADGTFADAHFSKASDTTVSISEDGVLQWNKGATGAEKSFILYFKEDQSDLGYGNDCCYVVSFDYKRPQANRDFFISVTGSKHRVIKANVKSYTQINDTAYHNIKIVFDTKNNLKHMLIADGTLLAAASSSGNSVNRLQFSTVKNNDAAGLVYSFDNFEVNKITHADYAELEAFYGISADSILGDNTSADAVTSDLTLADGVTWTSSNPSVISNTGVVTRPSFGYPLTSVVMTASTATGETREFAFKVKRADIEKPENIDGDYYYYDDFSNGSISERTGIVCPSGEVKDGKLYITSPSTGEAGFKCYVNENKSYIAGGVYAIEFDAQKMIATNESRMAYTMRTIAYDDWRYFSTVTAAASYTEAALGKSGKKYWNDDVNHYKYIIDTAKGTWSLYVNGILEYYEEPRNTAYNGQSSLQMLLINLTTKSSVLCLDNIKMYKLAEKTYTEGYTAKEIRKVGLHATSYWANVGYFATGLSVSDALAFASNLPVCAVAAYSGNKLKAVSLVEVTPIIYSQDNGVCGYSVNDCNIKIANASEIDEVAMFMWDKNFKPIENDIRTK